MTTAYWWDGDNHDQRNLGDLLSPILLEHFADLSVEWAPAGAAEIMCVGSVLDVLPDMDWNGVVVGAGQLHAETVTDLTFATVLGLRGTLTRLRVQCGDQRPVIGDPVLLASELVTPTPNAIEIGCAPHWSDSQLFPQELARARQQGYPEPTFIDVTGDPLTALTQIGSCRKLVASALHAVVAADAFGIPRRSETFPAMFTDAVHQGSTFKWLDYASALGQPVIFGKLQQAPKTRVDQIQFDLFTMFQSLKGRYV